MEKRIFVSPIDVPPLELATGKAQGSVHVNVIRSIFENNKLVTMLPVHRVAIVIQQDGSWTWYDQGEDEINDALIASSVDIGNQIKFLTEQFGIIDHDYKKDGLLYKIEYIKDTNTGKFTRSVTTENIDDPVP